MKKIIAVTLFGIIAGIGLTGANVQEASAGGAPWRDHAAPYVFLFDNHIDTHQQTMVKPDGSLFGFLYIVYTGEKIDGIPVAEHCDANTPAKKCVAGWIIRGKPGQATFLYHVADDHPVWLVESRSDIPQPGAYSHFHWTDEADGLVEDAIYDGYFLELQATERFYFRHAGEAILVRPGLDTATHVNIVGSFPGL